MKLLIGTGNVGKIREMREALTDLALDIVTLEQVDIIGTPTETGATFAENAEQKARFYFEQSHLPTIADDSGIIVDALQNELGLHTRRWGKGPDATDYEWVEFFLERMRRETIRRARFVCALCYIDETGTRHVFEGSCDGQITDELEADFLPGLPVSACFKPDGYDKVFSALTVQEKNAVSHRGRALQAFVDYMKSDAFESVHKRYISS